MKHLIPILLLFFTGCSNFSIENPRVDISFPIFVFEGEYVVDYKAHGSFHPWKKGLKGTPVLPAGVYTIDSEDNYILVSDNQIRTKTRKIVPYNPEDDLCKTDRMQGYECSPNYFMQAFAPDDPLVNDLWGLKADPGVNVLDVQFDTPNVKVAVLDTGVNCEHEDIECGSRGYNAISGEEGVPQASDDNGHGTHVAGTICAIGSNHIGIVGVSSGCAIFPIKFLGASGGGSLYDAVKGIRWAINNDIDIINASFGGGGYSQPFQDIITEAAEKGILFVAAAGNERNNNDEKPSYPSNYNDVLAVASLTPRGSISSFSNYGQKSVDVAAPGSNILSLSHLGGYKSLSGTSMAAPHVSGLAALVYEKERGLSKKEQRESVFRKITETARKNHLDMVTFGEVDAERILNIPQCEPEKCKECIRECTDRLRCKCNQLRKCRVSCRSETSCKAQCQP